VTQERDRQSKAAGGPVRGEGESVAGRRFREAEHGAGRIHRRPAARKAGDGSDPHVEENLDKGLEETFPASDPVSISPGAD
jgi:hypothetical protein